MNSPPLPTPSTVQPSERPRRWPRVVMLFAAIALIPLLWYGYSLFATRNAWADAEAETDRLDPRWRFADMEADRRIVPDAENSALHIQNTWQKGGVIGVTNAPTYFSVFKELLRPNEQMNVQQTALVRGELAKLGKRLQEARRLKDMPYGRFPLNNVDDIVGPDSVRRRMNVRHIVSDWLQHDAWLLAQDQYYDLAVQTCQACVMAGHALADEPFLHSYVIRIVTREEAVGTLERVLAQGVASDERLQAMQTVLEEEMKTDGWLRAMRGERASTHFFFENVRDGKVKFESGHDTCLCFSFAQGPQSLSDWIVKAMPSSAVNHYPEYLRYMNQYVNIAKLPIHERASALQEWETKHQRSGNPLIRMTISRFVSVHMRVCLYEARVRSAAVAIACERYRLRHKAWPATLDALLKEKLLGAIPADPMDNQPLRYHRTADGIVVYSIGWDRTDNQGNVDYTDENVNVFGPGMDVGFRLWNVSHRRQAPPPPAMENGR